MVEYGKDTEFIRGATRRHTYDAECAAIVRAIRVGQDRRKLHRVSKITIFTDTQAAINGCRPWRLALDGSVPYRQDVFRRKLTIRWRFVLPTRESGRVGGFEAGYSTSGIGKGS